MRSIFIWGCLLAALIGHGMSDMYLHFPPGSNNRLNGADVNVHNPNRLFNSQNNGKCGYNVGDNADTDPGATAIPEYRQLPMEFYMSGCDEESHRTEVEIMWTNQHGTGPMTDDMVETQVILQYMCQPYPQGKMASDNVDREFEFHTIRNGQSVTSQNYGDGVREDQYVSRHYGLHEPFNYFQAYYRRERNKGLFTADQQLAADRPFNTRQNAAGAIYGYEIPEERDYFPYWGPTPWKDIAIMVSNQETEELMKNYVNSSHYGHKYMCVMPNNLEGITCPPPNGQDNPAFQCIARYITAESCQNAGGTWTKFITNFLEKTSGVLSTCHDVGEMKLARGIPYEAYKISQGADNKLQYVLLHKPPDVIYAPSTVVNHNGMSLEGKFSTYKWKVPCFPSNTTQRCVLRLRYNITTDDVPREFNASNNDDITPNPVAKATDNMTDLQLALNTAQVGRTFQDRSHVFILKPRNRLPLKYQHANIFYIGGMGKRGNIVQTYPAMEYRFTPERITVTTKDVLCFVWSGSNNNPSHYAGQGQQSTDRTNVCWVKEGCSYLKPTACSSLPLEVVDHVDEFDSQRLNLHLSTGCYTGDLQQHGHHGQSTLQSQLDNAPASCNPPCFRITQPGEYCYMSTRNNNFSNRRHIGKITVTPASK